MMFFEYGLILLRYYSTDSALFLSLLPATYFRVQYNYHSKNYLLSLIYYDFLLPFPAQKDC